MFSRMKVPGKCFLGMSKCYEMSFRYKLKRVPGFKNFRATSKNIFTLCTNWTMPKAFKIAPNMAKTA